MILEVELPGTTTILSEILGKMVSKINFTALALACSLLSGCVTTGADGVEIAHVHRKAVSGEKTKIGAFMALERDCTSKIPNLRVTQAPQHGKVENVVENVLPKAQRPDFAKCKTRKVPGLDQYYTSASGYLGKDEFKVRISYANGMIKDFTVEIDVVK